MMYGSWDMEHDRQNFLSFWTIFCIFTPLTTKKNKNFEKMENTPDDIIQVYHKSQSYDVWFLRYWAQQTEFFVILGNFLPFYPSNNLKNQNFEKMREIITLYMCTINDNYMIYGSWDIKHDRQNCLSFWTVFWPFTNP